MITGSSRAIPEFEPGDTSHAPSQEGAQRITVRATARLEVGTLLGLLAICVACLMIAGPFITNDGPVHMSFARMLWSGFAGPLQAHFYVRKFTLMSNLLGDVLAGPMIAAFGSDAAETILQSVCLIGIPLAGWFVIVGLGSSSAVWAIVMAALSLNQMFFLGLYNYSLSLAAALFAFGMLVRVERGGTAWWWPGFGAMMALAFLAHIAGFIMAAIFAASWSVPKFVDQIGSRVAPRVLLRQYGPAILSIFPVLLLAQHVVMKGARSEILRGPGMLYRGQQLMRLDFLGTHGKLSAVAAQCIALLVISAGCWAALARLRRWSTEPASRLDTLRFSLLVVSGLALVVTFPDVAGGGWTHVRRMILIPYFAVLLLCATHPWGVRSRSIALACAGGLYAVLLGLAVREQILVHRIVAPLDRMLSLVGDHCTVLPIIPFPSLQTVSPPIQNDLPDSQKFSRTLYEPFYQVSTRLEQRGDRVALFNYIARLGVYPVSVRPGLDPQHLIFHWAPFERDVRIDVADPASFERTTGIPVSYILMQDYAPGITPPQLKSAAANYRLVANDDAIGFRLYERNPPACWSDSNALPTANPVPGTLSATTEDRP